ncbi:ABC transporter permease [Actinomadura sp. 3N407]|uniref:ABC transporter permease n=1 Tax=Actinomadura sp. 3N407 TaxID=3457423 RepID=UPI003FCE0E69
MIMKSQHRGDAGPVAPAGGRPHPPAGGPGGTAAAATGPLRGGRPGNGRRAGRRGVPDPFLGLLGAGVFVGLLELLPRTGVISPDELPPFSEIARALAGEAGSAAFWGALLDTLRGWGYGLGIALAAGLSLGLLIGSVPFLREATASTIEFLRPIPSVALVPLAVLLYGTQIGSTLMLVVYAAGWPVLLQAIHGVQDVDPVARDTAAAYRFSPWARLRYLVWPTALPYLMTGVRLAASVALILAVAGELIIGAPGLGSAIALAQASNAVAEMYALIFVTGALGVCVNLLARALERRVLAWHSSVRTEVPV